MIEDFHPEVEIYAAAVDPELNANGYIISGFGDAETVRSILFTHKLDNIVVL